MTRLQARALRVSLGGRPVLSGIDLDLEPGCFTAILGPNGAGKTTLMRALAGLVVPGGGTVLLDGRPVSRMRAGERARAIAYLPQGGGVAWPLPVRQVVALGRLPYGETPDALPPDGREAVDQALLAADLAGFEDRPATALSGGERARVLLARALATRAPVLLADEPIAALDPRHELLVLAVLRAQARAGALVVAIMHNLTLAARFADRIALLDRGGLAAHAAPAQVLTPARLAATFGIRAHVRQTPDGLVVVAEEPLPEGLPRPGGDRD